MYKNFLLFFSFFSILLLAACSGGNESEEETDDSSAENNGKGDVTIGLISEPVTMDPHGSNDIPSAQLRTQLYDTLVEQTADMELEPGLAESWEQVDEETWRFELKEGVKFHNGSDFTAEDVKATFDRVLDPTVGSSVAFLFEMIEEIEVVDDYEILLHTDYSFAPLLSHLAHNTGGILSKEAIDADYENALTEAGVDMSLEEYYEARSKGGDDFESASEEMGEYIGRTIAENPDGTDHLKLQNRDPGNEVILERFEDFHGEERNFDTVTYRVIPENSARLAELETGGIMVTDSVDADNMPRVEEHEDTQIIDQEGLSMSYLAFNTEKEPFNDPNVRQAISSAVDRENIIDGVLNGRGIHGSNHISPSVNGFDEDAEQIEYSLDKARELLSESDVPDGFSTTLWVSDSEETVDIALYMQETLGEIGIDVEIEQFEFGAFLDKAREGTHDMLILSWITVTADADYGLYPMFHTDSQDGSGNRWLYSNPELDDILDQGRQSTEEDERMELYKEAQGILREDLPVTPLYYSELGIGVNETLIDGVELDPVGIVRLENVSFPE